MKVSTLYDIKKESNNKYKKIYKSRKKVINTKINTYNHNNKMLYLTSAMMVVAGLSTIGLAEVSKDIFNYADFQKIAGIVLIILPPIIYYYGKDNSHKKEIEELKKQKREINKQIKDLKISHEKKLSLKEIRVFPR